MKARYYKGRYYTASEWQSRINALKGSKKWHDMGKAKRIKIRHKRPKRWGYEEPYKKFKHTKERYGRHV
jgi:hypothetical protein